MAQKLYDGEATITDIEFQELRFTEGLTEEQIEASMNIAITVKPDDESFGELIVETEASPRLGIGNNADKTRFEMARADFEKQDLITDGDITTIVKAVGKKVHVYQKESKPDKNGKVWTRTYFGNGAKKIDKAAALARLAKLTGSSSGSPSTPKDNPFA